MNLQETLSKIYSIINKSIVVLSSTEKVIFPQDCDFKIQFSELTENMCKNYLGYNVYKIQKSQEAFFICIQSEEYVIDETTELILYMIEKSLNSNSTSDKFLINLLSENVSDQELLRFQDKFSNWLNCYLILLECSCEQKEEIKEIIMHSIDTQLVLDYNNNLLIISNDDNIENACNNLAENILSDLYIECIVAIGGKIESLKILKKVYLNCLQALDLKKKFNLSSYVMNYEKMLIYRIISNMSIELKQSILNSVLNLDDTEVIDNEMEITIDSFFKNNLNLTDTAKSIFIHRNTLLYRIEKFQKQTGFDLKNFDDSWLLKLAWLIRQEMKNK